MEKLKAYFSYLEEQHTEHLAVDLLEVCQQSSKREYTLLTTETVQAGLHHGLTRWCEMESRERIGQQQGAVFATRHQEKDGCSSATPAAQELLLQLLSEKPAILRKYLPQYTRHVDMVVEILEEFDVLSRGKHLQIETKLRTETQNLEKANQFLTAILDNIPHMIFVKEAKELRFIRFNKAGENLVGYSHEELEGKNDYDFFPEEQANFFIAKDRDVLQNKTLVDIKEEPIQTKNHGERWLHTKKIPLLAEDGTPRFLLGISEDITEFKKQEDAIRELNKEIESFSYSVSHDLRAPLRAIHGYAKILEEDFEDKLDQEAKRLLEVIRHNAQRMGTLIDDLLSLSRLGRKEISLSSLDMNELVEGAVREINRSHPHTAHITYGTLLPVQGDYGLIHLVVFNLLSNALKYSSKTAQPLIHIESHKTATEIVYSIRDNGVGFNMKYVDKLFGVFQRLHAADEFDGTGVGLAVVKRIVTRHGGHVAATGKVNEGATFQFSLPAS